MLKCDIVHAFICCINRHVLVGHSPRSSLSSYLGSLSFNTEYRSTTSAALSDLIILSSLLHSRLTAAALYSLCGTRLSKRWKEPIQTHIYQHIIPFLQLFNITQKPWKYQAFYCAQRNMQYIFRGKLVSGEFSYLWA